MHTQLELFDWLFIAGYCVLAFGIGIYFSKRASQNIEEYFIAGRRLPWWLAGTSIVATTFAVDTPLAVSGIIRKDGIAGNWLWWNAAMGGMLCAMFYARLWRRANILTDVELIELRYEGRPASVLRGFMAVYGGVVANCITMGWVMMAMSKICRVMLGWNELWSLTALVVLALIYTVLSGFWGVVMTDFIQFIMAMVGAVVLAVIVVSKAGGPTAMIEKLTAASDVPANTLDLVPNVAVEPPLAVTTFVILISAMWWGGGQGGGVQAQRFFSTRSEKHAILASVWFNFAHYVLRPWPWIVVGIASLIFIPVTAGEDPEAAYPQMMAKFLPVGLRGLMVASFLAAFMSTMDTHLNWGSSYLVNDLYRRFIHKQGSPAHYVFASRVACLIMVVLAALTAWQMDSIKQAWVYLMVLGAGTGLVGLLRWFWWRVNAWAEISAMAGSLLLANGGHLVKLGHYIGLLDDGAAARAATFYSEEWFAVRAVSILVICTVLWIIVAHLTPPVSTEHLERFYRRVRPGGWWGPIARRCPDVHVAGSAAQRWFGWLLGVACIYGGLFGIGHLCLARFALGIVCVTLSAAAGIMLLVWVKRFE